MADGYRVAQLDDFELKPWRETLTGRVRHEFGITAFGVNSWVGPNVGDRVIPEHAEDQEGDPDELYVVIRGRARFEVNEDTFDAPQGTLVYVPAGPNRRTAFAEEPETIVLAVGATAGKAYSRSALSDRDNASTRGTPRWRTTVIRPEPLPARDPFRAPSPSGDCRHVLRGARPHGWIGSSSCGLTFPTDRGRSHDSQ